MRIAACYDKETGDVFGHFGATEYFKLYDLDETSKEITETDVKSTEGYSHTALVGLLKYFGADVVLTGGIGGHGRDLLDQAGIQYYPGVQGNADERVADLIAGKLQFDMSASCPHHDHDHGGCGHHH
ncbi:MAG: dinitrogenase iron-molybdenum cofactor biosynthesis protein [Clostridia bacterium]|nr:dinitrogenase iron-molybdenum cofactor biosynthesis protein [Clostridia bacterium]MBR1704772.1 dinitrogenase iron-molybdenum cofactor biosynthesis protein [Clostridia bacterium]